MNDVTLPKPAAVFQVAAGFYVLQFAVKALYDLGAKLAPDAMQTKSRDAWNAYAPTVVQAQLASAIQAEYRFLAVSVVALTVLGTVSNQLSKVATPYLSAAYTFARSFV